MEGGRKGGAWVSHHGDGKGMDGWVGGWGRGGGEGEDEWLLNFFFLESFTRASSTSPSKE